MRATRDAPAPATAKGAATRAFLLHTSAGVFAERGYAATTMGELIAASRLTKGAFYFHFRSKAELAPPWPSPPTSRAAGSATSGSNWPPGRARPGCAGSSG